VIVYLAFVLAVKGEFIVSYFTKGEREKDHVRGLRETGYMLLRLIMR